MLNTTNTILDRIKSRRGIKSDYALAQAFGRDQSFVTNYRRGPSQFSEDVAVEAAKLAEVDPALLLIQIQAERAKSPEVRQQFLRAADMIKHALAA